MEQKYFIDSEDIRKISELQRAYSLAIENQDYDLALRLTNDLDQIYYSHGIDLVRFVVGRK